MLSIAPKEGLLVAYTPFDSRKSWDWECQKRPSNSPPMTYQKPPLIRVNHGDGGQRRPGVLSIAPKEGLLGADNPL